MHTYTYIVYVCNSKGPSMDPCGTPLFFETISLPDRHAVQQHQKP